MKILFIIGSLRKDSFNRKLAKIAENMIGDRAEVIYLENTVLPPVNQDKEFPVQKEISELREAIKACDGVWIFTPEYNASYPGHLKTIFDWLSRPDEQGGGMKTTANGLKLTVSNVGGSRAGSACREKLFELADKIMMLPMKSPICGLALSDEEFETGEIKLNEERTQILEEQIQRFLDFLAD